MSKRVWFFTRNEWDPHHRWLPLISGDEYGRRTLVLPVPFRGYVVIAYWTCKCGLCDEMREQTARWEAEAAA